MKQPDSPRIGVFVCECGKNIAATVDCDSVRDYAESLDGVVCAVKSKYTCSEPGQKEVQKWIKEEKLDRVVISACSPRVGANDKDPAAAASSARSRPRRTSTLPAGS